MHYNVKYKLFFHTFNKEIELLDIHKPPKIGKTKSVKVHDLLLEKGLVIG